MPTIQIEPNLKVRTDKILNGIAQLDMSDLEDFLLQVSNVLARKKTQHLPKKESELLIAINEPWSEKKAKKFQQLSEKLHSETISPAEHKDYMKLVDERQDRSIARLKNLIELAAIRKVSVATLTEQLGINSPS